MILRHVQTFGGKVAINGLTTVPMLKPCSVSTITASP